MVAAGFTAGEADGLRRAMAAWKRRGGLEKFERKLKSGMLERGYEEEFAERVWGQIQGFGEYGFPESHAASFALLAYVSAWLKCHEPAVFCCALLNSQPMGFYTPSQLVQDVRAHGVEVRGADVQASGWDYRLESGAIRVGLRQVKGLREETARTIESQQPFRDIDDLARRGRLEARELTVLARASALESLSGHRYQAHWDAAGVARPTHLETAANGKQAPYRTEVELPAPAVGQELLADYRYLGLTLGPHPMELLRSAGEFRGCRSALELKDSRNGQFIEVAGVVTCRQRRAARPASSS